MTMKSGKEKLGIYGGTFSPIHAGHVKAALAFLEEMELDRLLVIPTAIPPHKDAVEGAGNIDRLNMARLAFSECDAYARGRLQVSDYEITKADKSYTVYTLEHFSSEERDIYLLMGTDMFLTLDKWFRAQDIFRLANITLMRRESDADSSIAIDRKAAEYRELYGAKLYFINVAPIEVSSTALRRMIAEGTPANGLIPDAVEKYIIDNGLYR